MYAGMDLVAARTVVGSHSSVVGTGMVRFGSGPFARASATAYVVGLVALDVVPVAVLSFVAAAAEPSLDSSGGRGS